jgi:hypothetical protein
MTSDLLGQSYFIKAEARLKVLILLMEERDYSDVVREAQEIVELTLKGVLRKKGIEPPKLHDVGPVILEHRAKLSPKQQEDVQRVADISKWLRKEREFAFYGDIDLIPSEEYKLEDARRAELDAEFVVQWARESFG